MISFYGDSSVPPELCRLLYRSVPEGLHVPVVFRNRRPRCSDNGRKYPAGVCKMRRNGTWIEINLNPLYGGVMWRGSLAAALWKTLLEVCLHEFGHVATIDEWYDIHPEAYKNDFKVHQYVERLADKWAAQCIQTICRNDPRLGQPRVLSGYLGARVARRMARLAEHKSDSGWALAKYVKERRCWKTGGQFTAGDVLTHLGLPPWRYRNAYSALRRVSAKAGIDYTDAAGRRHKLYTWGDVPVLANRLKNVRLTEWPRESSGRDLLASWLGKEKETHDGL